MSAVAQLLLSDFCCSSLATTELEVVVGSGFHGETCKISFFKKAIVVNDLSVCVRERENEGYQREDFVALLGMMGIPPVSIVYTVGLFFHVI